MKQQLHVFFSGTVQGVGFRYRARDVARRTHVAGWVRNLPDGRVEAVAEGEHADLLAFLAGVREEMGANIAALAPSWSDDTEGLSGFEIKPTIAGSS